MSKSKANVLMMKSYMTYRMGEVYGVNPGFARNFLIPNQMGQVATPEVLKQQEALRAERAKLEAAQRAEVEKVAEKMKGLKLKTKRAVVMKDGKPSSSLYASVSAKDISELLEKEGYQIAQNQVSLAKAIKSAGNHNVLLKLGFDVEVTVPLEVQADVIETATEKSEEAAAENPADEKAASEEKGSAK